MTSQSQTRTLSVQDRIKAHEGLRLNPYLCPTGHVTIGYGHKIEAITEADAEALFQQDFSTARRAALSACMQHGVRLDAVRVGVLIEMAFQLGEAGLLGFKDMWAALTQHDYEQAAASMCASRWHRETPHRVEMLAKCMRSGVE